MAGETLWTRDHQTIRRWAEERGALPAIGFGAALEDGPGAPRLEFLDAGGQNLTQVSWDQFFKAFDERDLMFVYQETEKSGQKSHFCRFDKPPGDGP